MKAYRVFFAKYLAGSDIGDTNYLTGYQQGMILEQILKQCDNDPSRENIVKQAKKPEGSRAADCHARHLDQHQRDQQHDLDATSTAALERH
jgi:hypothetical protein